MPRRVNELECPAENGCLIVTTEREYGTFVSWYTSGGMFGVLSNTPQARRFLRVALKRMERDKHIKDEE